MVQMRFAGRHTFRRWFPVWFGLVRYTSLGVVGVYVRVLSRAAFVQWGP